MPKVMIVDDSNVVRMAVKSILEKAGYEVYEAENGYDCLEKLGSLDPDLFLIDLNMPKMDGVELIKKLKGNSEFSHKPIVILSTEENPEVIAEVEKLGVTEYLKKPPDPMKLIKIVGEFIAK